MTRTRKKAPQGGRKRTLLIAVLVVLATIITVVALTEPRQLPARIADHTAVRMVYAWRDNVQDRVHRMIYPLSDLREEQHDPQQDGVGYDKDDRKALDELLESKTP